MSMRWTVNQSLIKTMLILLDSFLATPVLKHAWGTAYEGELYLKQGARLSLKCEIANTTIAEITWYKGDDPLPSQRYSSKSVIDIQKTSADDFGVYECKAKNSLGVVSKKIKVVNGEEILKELYMTLSLLGSLQVFIQACENSRVPPRSSPRKETFRNGCFRRLGLHL